MHQIWNAYFNIFFHMMEIGKTHKPYVFFNGLSKIFFFSEYSYTPIDLNLEFVWDFQNIS